jgi:hypothetical protein
MMRLADQATGFLQFRLTDAGLFGRRVAKPVVPDCAPGYPQHAEHKEGCTPSVVDLDGHHQQGRDRPAELARHQ